MTWEAIKYYFEKNTVEIVISGFVLVIFTTLLYDLVKWSVTKTIDFFKGKAEHKKIKNRIKSFTLSQLDKQINSKKYLPNCYTEITDVKEILRYFCLPLFFCNKVIDFINNLDFSHLNIELQKKHGRKIQITKISGLGHKTQHKFDKKTKEIKHVLDANLTMLSKISNDEVRHFLAERKLSAAKEKNESLRARILVILDTAGQGKTNLICDLTKEFLLKLDIPVALFFGSDFCGVTNKSIINIISEECIKDANPAKLDRFITRECRKDNKPFVVIIDALNESRDANFSSALEAFLRNILSNEFVRVILTCRTEYYDLNFKSLETASFALHISKNKGINSRMQEHEKDALFRKYLDTFRVGWQSFSGVVYKKLVDNFLLLRIYCEVNQGQKIGSVLNVYMLDLFEKYYRQIRDKINKEIKSNDTAEKVICSVTDYMVGNKSYSDMPLQTIVDRVKIDKNILIKLVDENILFRRDIISKTGVLLDEEVVSFTFDELRDYLIADYLVNVLQNKDKEKMERFISEEVVPGKNLFEGVSKYLFFFSKKDRQNQILSKAIESTSWYSNKYIPYLFQTNDDYITQEDVMKLRGLYLSDNENAREIFNWMVFYRFDANMCKNLNISFLYDVLTIMADDDLRNKFTLYLHRDRGGHPYSLERKGDSILDVYFDFLERFFEKANKYNQSLEFLFFISACEEDRLIQAKIEKYLALFFKNYPKEAMQMLEKYKKSSATRLKHKADVLIDRHLPKAN